MVVVSCHLIIDCIGADSAVGGILSQVIFSAVRCAIFDGGTVAGHSDAVRCTIVCAAVVTGCDGERCRSHGQRIAGSIRGVDAGWAIGHGSGDGASAGGAVQRYLAGSGIYRADVVTRRDGVGHRSVTLKGQLISECCIGSRLINLRCGVADGAYVYHRPAIGDAADAMIPVVHRFSLVERALVGHAREPIRCAIPCRDIGGKTRHAIQVGAAREHGMITKRSQCGGGQCRSRCQTCTTIEHILIAAICQRRGRQCRCSGQARTIIEHACIAMRGQRRGG